MNLNLDGRTQTNSGTDDILNELFRRTQAPEHLPTPRPPWKPKLTDRSLYQPPLPSGSGRPPKRLLVQPQSEEPSAVPAQKRNQKMHGLAAKAVANFMDAHNVTCPSQIGDDFAERAIRSNPELAEYDPAAVDMRAHTILANRRLKLPDYKSLPNSAAVTQLFDSDKGNRNASKYRAIINRKPEAFGMTTDITLNAVQKRLNEYRLELGSRLARGDAPALSQLPTRKRKLPADTQARQSPLQSTWQRTNACMNSEPPTSEQVEPRQAASREQTDHISSAAAKRLLARLYSNRVYPMLTLDQLREQIALEDDDELKSVGKHSYKTLSAHLSITNDPNKLPESHHGGRIPNSKALRELFKANPTATNRQLLDTINAAPDKFGLLEKLHASNLKGRRSTYNNNAKKASGGAEASGAESASAIQSFLAQPIIYDSKVPAEPVAEEMAFLEFRGASPQQNPEPLSPATRLVDEEFATFMRNQDAAFNDLLSEFTGSAFI